MGCGRSTLGSDSPKKNKRNGDGDSEGDNEDDVCGVGGGRKQLNSNKLVCFGTGGPLLAQAKISESQQDFFMMLDEKIENGPDYDSETEEVERRRRMHEYSQHWTAVSTLPPPPSPPRALDEDTCGSGDITEEDEDDDDDLGEPGRIPDEAVREQYMFMGSVYTLTHVRTDEDKVEPKVDVVAASQLTDELGDYKHTITLRTVEPKVDKTDTKVDIVVSAPVSEHEGELNHKLNGSAVSEVDENERRIKRRSDEKADDGCTDEVEVEVDVPHVDGVQFSHKFNGTAEEAGKQVEEVGRSGRRVDDEVDSEEDKREMSNSEMNGEKDKREMSDSEMNGDDGELKEGIDNEGEGRNDSETNGEEDKKKIDENEMNGVEEEDKKIDDGEIKEDTDSEEGRNNSEMNGEEDKTKIDGIDDSEMNGVEEEDKKIDDGEIKEDTDSEEGRNDSEMNGGEDKINGIDDNEINGVEEGDRKIGNGEIKEDRDDNEGNRVTDGDKNGDFECTSELRLTLNSSKPTSLILQNVFPSDTVN